MNISARSTLAQVAACVAGVLSRAKIRAVLTGGACAMLYSKGEYQSSDLDFILQSAMSRQGLDDLMKSIGFRRIGNHHEHPRTALFVEFPAGPLGIGADIDIRSVVRRIGGIGVRLLSPTDSCRDRLLAFYHWNDRQSLNSAIQIARHSNVNLRALRVWSGCEDAPGQYAEFLRALSQYRRQPRRKKRPAASSRKRTKRSGLKK